MSVQHGPTATEVRVAVGDAVLPAEKRLVIVPGATHLFEEPGALEEVARLAADWFSHYLGGDDDAR